MSANQPICKTCGVLWVDHMGIEGTCAENAKLRKERDEARREVSELKANEANRLSSAVRLKGWICFEEEEMACDKVSQEVSQEGSKLPTTISSNGICITEYIPPQNSVREIPPYGAYTTGECTLSVHTIKKTQ